MKPPVATLRLGTRSSRLALWQTERVASALKELHPGLDTAHVPITTEGDRDRSTPLPEIGGRGVFTEALERSLQGGEIDLAVHSLKDLPLAEQPGLILGAICFRDDPRDVVVAVNGWTLDSLPAHSRVGTSSTRRLAQLAALRPDLRLLPLRGNVDTRVRKVFAGEYDAIVIAAAGVHRLGLAGAVTEYLPFERMLPAPGQGALAVQCRADDGETLALLASLDEPTTRAAVSGERAFLAGTGGGCAAPVAAHAALQNGGHLLRLEGLVSATDGSRAVRVAGSAPVEDAEQLGRRLAEEALRRGAKELLL